MGAQDARDSGDELQRIKVNTRTENMLHQHILEALDIAGASYHRNETICNHISKAKYSTEMPIVSSTTRRQKHHRHPEQPHVMDFCILD